MNVGDKILVAAEVISYDDTLGCFIAQVSDPDWFQDESGHLTESSKHWKR